MPLDADERTVELLEFSKIRREILEAALSEPGAALLRERGFSRDETVIRRELTLVAEIQRRLAEEEARPEGGVPDVTASVDSLRHEGAILEPEELNEIARFLGGVRRLHNWLFREEGGALEALQGDLGPARELEAGIRRYIGEDGSIKEEAIPELQAVRRRIARTRGEIDELVRSYFQRSDREKVFTSDLPTQRDGRTVLPVSSDHRGKIGGIVHEVSQTGATLFVEPEALVEKNNALVELEGRAFQAIRRALAEVSDALRVERTALHGLIGYLAVLDSYYARALYAHRLDAVVPTVAGEGGALILRRARHPLLGPRCVPISLEVTAGTRALIITGPNTGGKTVSLKTVGLFALMHQFGLPLPGESGTTMPIFSSLHADIGDEQSLEESLSTFSGHMQRISGILDRIGPSSLVLLDELGSGTDYEEGAALSMAILDECIRRAGLTIATTHHTVLKQYGFTRKEAENVSVSFDAATHRPTFELRVGEPGASHALDIASHNGIPPTLIAQARSYLDEQQSDIAEIIRQLTEEQTKLKERSAELEEQLRRRRREEQKLLEEREALRAREEELRREGLRELRSFSAEARRKLENLVRELREAEITREKTQAVKEYIQELEEAEARQTERFRDESSRMDEAPGRSPGGREGRRRRTGPGAGSRGRGGEAPAAGQEVIVTANGRKATLLRENRDGSWLVAAGPVKLSLGRDEFEPAGPAGRGSRRGEVHVSYDQDSAPAPRAELDLRGHRLEEALAALDDQIDRALVTGLNRFSVIHGMGEGVLQKGVRSHLAGHGSVTAFHYASPEEGGFGKTIVELGG
ncbi:MAG: endonuclease MutS2 [Spirochaetaceae bacterium]